MKGKEPKMTPAKRLEKLERQLAETKKELSAMKACIRTRRLVVKGANGKIRARLGLHKGKPRLALCDQNGDTRVWLSAGEEGACLHLYDARRRRATLCVTKSSPQLKLFDKKGKPIWKVP
jgi:hypothetical protein